MANIFKPKRSSTASSVPTTSDLADGEIAVNSSDKKIYLRDGQSVVEVANANIVDDTTPQLGGTLDTNGNLIQFGDSGSATDDRLQFGASQDLQIYHDGSQSYIGADDLRFVNKSISETYAIFTNNGSVALYYDNNKKFETTTSGATVTDALRVTDSSTYTVDVGANGQDGALISTLGSSASLALGTNSTERLRIDSSGRLLKSGQASLTSTSLSHPIQVAAASDANAIAIIGRASDDISELSFYEADKTTNLGEIQYRRDHVNFRHRVGDIRFATGGTTERLRIQSNGQILFSGSSGDNQFTSKRTNSTSSSGDYFFQLNAQNNSSTTVGSLGFHRDTATDDSRFVIFTRNTGGSNTERLRITSDGKIGINDSAPIDMLTVKGGSSSVINSSTGNRVWHAGTTNGHGLMKVSRSDSTVFIRADADSKKLGLNTDSPHTNLHVVRSESQYDTHGIIKLESTNSNTGSATNASLIAKNRYGWAQFMQWEDKGLRIGSRSTTTGGTGDVYVTAGADSVAAVIKANGNIGINDSSPNYKLSVNNGTEDGNVLGVYNDEIGVLFGTYGTGSSYPREVTINGTRFDQGSAPYLRIGGQGGIKFCADLNSVRLQIGPSGQIGLGGANYGTSGQVLTSNGSSSAPTWQNAGAGTDAGTLDGLDSSQFLRSDADDGFSGTITGTADNSGNPVLGIKGPGPNIIRFFDAPGNTETSLGIDLVYRTGANTLGFEKSTDGSNLWQTDCDTGVTNFNYNPTVTSNTIWHAGNDGSGSGLDADTVDGIQATSFLRSDADDTMAGNLTVDPGETQLNRGNSAGDILRLRGQNTEQHVFTTHGAVFGSSAYGIFRGSSSTGGSGAANGFNAVVDEDGGTNLDSNYYYKVRMATGSTGTDNSAVYVFWKPGDGAWTNRYVSRSGSTSNHPQATTNVSNGTQIRLFTDHSSAYPIYYTVERFRFGEPDQNIQGHGADAHWQRSGNTLNYSDGGVTIAGSTAWHAGIDGAGSGLDADTLDGVQASSFLRSDATDNTDTNVKIRFGGASITQQSGSSAVVQINGFSRIGALAMHRSANPTSGNGAPDADHEWLTNIGGVLRWGSNANTGDGKVWHSGNDGSGSGLDADTLDGLSSGSFLRTDATTTFNASGNDLNFDYDSNRTIWSVNRSGTRKLHLHTSGDTVKFSLSNSAKLNFVNGFSVGTDTHHKFVHIRQDSSTTKHQVLIQNRTNAVSTAGIAFIASGSDFSDGQYAAIECLSGGTGTTSQSLKFVTSASGGTPATALTIGSDQVMTGGTFHLGGSQIMSSGASLQVNGFMRTGSIYLHQGGGTPNSSSVEFANVSQQPYWDTNKIWHAGNDGSGSGLDADTVDGIQGASFLRSDATDNTSTNAKTRFGGSSITGQSGSDAVVQINGFSRIGALAMHRSANPTNGNGAPDADHEWLTNISGVLRWGSNASTGDGKVWHSGNDGSGSGLDADTLDGIDSGSFLRSDATDISTQRISFKANTTNNWDTIATTSGGLGSIEVRNDGAGNDAFMAFHAAGDYAIYFGLDADANDLAVGGWSMGANKYKVWHAGNDGAGSGLDADLWDGNQFSSYLNQALLTSSSPQFANIYSSAWLRNNNTGQGLYNQANDAHFYSAGSEYWHINGNSENITSSGLVFYDRYQASQGNATGRKGYVYWDSNGFGLLGAAGQWAVNIRSTGTDVVFGGHTGNNHYDSVSSARISFGGGNDFANYSVGTSLENYGGNYTKLDLRWHTGIRIGAQAVYGGTRIFNNEDFSTLLFSVGRGDGNTRVESGNFRAPSYYDTDDTGYYINYNAGGNQILELNVGNKSTSYRRTTLHSSGKLTVAYGDNALHDVLYLKNNHMTAAGHGARIMWHLGNGGTQRNGPRIEGYAASNYSTDAHADSELRFYTTNDNSHVHVLRLRNTGNAEVLGNLYAPAVYDYNDSAYYLNPNGTSVLNAIAFGGATSVTSGYAMQAGGAIHMNNRNINHVNQLHFHDGVRFVGMDNDQYLKYRWDDTGAGGIRFYDGNDTHHGYIYGDGNGRFGLLDNDGSWSYKAGLGSEALQLHCNGDLEFEVTETYTKSLTSSRAPIFHDSDNTSYYLDPASGSVVGTIHFDNSINFTGQGGWIGRNHAYNTLELLGYGAELMIGCQSTSINVNYRTCNNGTGNHTPTTWYWRAGSSSSFSNHNFGNVNAANFYDRENTAYVVNPGGDSTINGLFVDSKIYFKDSVSTDDSRGVYFDGGSSKSYAIYKESGAWSNPYPDLVIGFHTGIKIGGHKNYNGTRFYNSEPGGTPGALVMEVANGNDNVRVVNTFTASGDSRAPIFYDSNDTNYYTNPADTSYVKYLGRRDHNTGFLVGSYNNVGGNSYKSNPIYAIGSSYLPNNDTLANFYGIGYSHPNASFYPSHSSGWGMYVAANGSARVVLDGDVGKVIGTGAFYGTAFYDYSSTGYYLDPSSSGTSLNVAGAIVAAGNVTAYSDLKFKENIKVIPDAVEKVKAMRGVTYTRNDLEDREVRHTGVIAQEVEQVLPEAVREGINGKTVAYGNMVGLLIEAIKEQQEMINRQQDDINNLKQQIKDLQK